MEYRVELPIISLIYLACINEYICLCLCPLCLCPFVIEPRMCMMVAVCSSCNSNGTADMCYSFAILFYTVSYDGCYGMG